MTLQLTATAKDTANVVLAVTITWSSSNTLAATVNSSTGLVTAVANGSATITASADGKSGTATITVQLVASVNMSPANASVRVGALIQVGATPPDGSGNVLTGLAVSWSSDDENVATVDADGFTTGVGIGTAVITAEIDGTTGSAGVTVWLGVTGTWSGGFDFPAAGGSCGITLSLTQDSKGDFTGTGDLTGPACVTVPLTYVGTNNTGAVPDSVAFLFSSPGLPDVPFNGTFDGFSMITGELSGPIVSSAFSVTRTGFTPLAPPAAAPAGTSGAHGTYARPEENR